MAPGNANTSTSAISANLSAAIADSFGSLDAMKADLTAAANGVFGSGWAWLAMPTDRSGRGDGSLVITATPNQDNPLMKVGSKALPGAAFWWAPWQARAIRLLGS